MDVNNDDNVQTVQVAGFISKTFEILNNQQYSKIIYWGPTGTQFVIKDITKFQQIVLPKFFRHNKINSFIRQLNMYGFHKSRKDHSKSVFSHPLFLKDREDLLPSIKRKIKQNQNEQGQGQNNFNTPAKLKPVVKQQMETVMTGRQLIQSKQKPMPSFKHFNNNFESYGASFKHLFESKQTFSRSNFNLNFSMNKISLNFNQEQVSKLNFKEVDEDDNISIADRIQDINQRQKDIFGLGMPSLPRFMNPSCFFNSFDSRK